MCVKCNKKDCISWLEIWVAMDGIVDCLSDIVTEA